MKHWQQQFVVPEFVKATIGVKIVDIFVMNIINSLEIDWQPACYDAPTSSA
jgi:hypothetical protein